MVWCGRLPSSVMTGDGKPTLDAVASANDSWTLVEQLQDQLEPDHEDFAAYAAQVVTTLQALQDLTRVLETQVRGYPRNRILADAQGRDPAYRIIDSVAQTAHLARRSGARPPRRGGVRVADRSSTGRARILSPSRPLPSGPCRTSAAT